MRYLRVTLPPDILPVNVSVEEGHVFNIRYLSDGSVLQLVRAMGDFDTAIGEVRRDPQHSEFEILHQDSDQIVFYLRLIPHTDSTGRMFVEVMDQIQLNCFDRTHNYIEPKREIDVEI